MLVFYKKFDYTIVKKFAELLPNMPLRIAISNYLISCFAIIRLEKYDKLVRKFEHKAGLREDWLTEMEDLSERLQKMPGTQAGSARKAEALRMEIESKEKRFRELDNLATEIGKYKEYQQGVSVQQHNAKIQNRWATLSGPKMRALLARLAFPQTRADMMEQLELMMNKTKELEVSKIYSPYILFDQGLVIRLPHFRKN